MGISKKREEAMVIDRIAAQMKHFSLTNKKIADFVINNKHEIGFASVTALSQQVKVSKASVVRFAQAVGFEGFNQFKLAIQKELKQQLSPYSKVLCNDLDMLSKEKQLKKLVDNEIANLGKTLNALDVTIVMDIVEHMGKAGKIFVSGFGRNGPMAKKFIHSLRIITDKRIEQVTGAVSDFSPALSSLANGDIVFIMTLPSYSAEIFPLAEYVKKQKGFLCLLTDSPKCPIYDSADAVLLCESNSLTLANSYVAIMTVTQVITDMFFLYCKKEGVRSVKAIWKMEEKGYDFK
jgi:DNA-binding MurR/RpiR family transcriptional regulator